MTVAANDAWRFVQFAELYLRGANPSADTLGKHYTRAHQLTLEALARMGLKPLTEREVLNQMVDALLPEVES